MLRNRGDKLAVSTGLSIAGEWTSWRIERATARVLLRFVATFDRATAHPAGEQQWDERRHHGDLPLRHIAAVGRAVQGSPYRESARRDVSHVVVATD